MKKKIKEKNMSLYIDFLLSLLISCTGIYFIHQFLYMNDAFWHIKTGEWVSKYGLIDKCYGSWVIKNQAWIAHEWLFGWILYGVSQLGMDSIVRFFGVLYLLTVFLCCYQAGMIKKSETPPMLYWEIVVFFSSLFMRLE